MLTFEPMQRLVMTASSVPAIPRFLPLTVVRKPAKSREFVTNSFYATSRSCLLIASINNSVVVVFVSTASAVQASLQQLYCTAAPELDSRDHPCSAVVK